MGRKAPFSKQRRLADCSDHILLFTLLRLENCVVAAAHLHSGNLLTSGIFHFL